jgi:hypothetical protein
MRTIVPSISAASTATAPRRAWKWLTALPYDRVRDAFLVSAGLLYLLGYAVWSMHAWRNNLGLLPLLEAQYLLAGFIVACILLGGVACAWVAWWVRERIPGTLTPERARTGWRKVLRRAWLTVIVASFAGLLIADADWVKQRYAVPETVAVTFAGILISAALFLLPALEGVPDKPYQKFFHRLMSLYSVLFIVIFALLFQVKAFDVYTSHWPQELAGPRPRCAYVDFDVVKFAPETAAQLLPPSTVQDSSARIVRSDPLQIFFAGNTLLVKPTRAAGPADETYEIDQDAVATITWCAS